MPSFSPQSVPQWIFHQVKKIGHPKKPAVAPTESHEVVIVGGGVAGLYTAYQLVKSGVTDIIVLEGRGAVGGRITTTRDKDGNPLFNNFGWRVGEVNTEMISLAKELGINLIPQVTPPEDKAVEDKDQCKHGTGGHVCSVTTAERETYVVPDGRAPLSDFATACLIGASQADKQDRKLKTRKRDILHFETCCI